MNFDAKKICPGEEKLADYLEGRLSGEARSQMEEHMADCEICLEAFVASRRIAQAGKRATLESVPTDVTESAVRLVCGWDPISPTSAWERFQRSARDLYERTADLLDTVRWGELAYTATRGTKRHLANDLYRSRKTFADIEAEIEIEKTGVGKSLIRIKLTENMKGESIRATLKQGGREIYSDLINDGNHVLFEDVPVGSYDLVLTREDVELGTYRFMIKDEKKP